MVEKSAINVACAIIVSKGKVLVAQRSESMSLPLKWEFPGGKINANESAEDCINRELMEELNITVQIIERFHDHAYNYGTFAVNLVPFLCDYTGGDIILAEHKSAIWFEIGELQKLDWAAADVEILNYFIKLYHA